jgi:hypothetical protein
MVNPGVKAASREKGRRTDSVLLIGRLGGDKPAPTE